MYERQAEQAEKLAAIAKTEYERDALIKIAQSWRALIAERARNKSGPLVPYRGDVGL